MLKHEFKVGQTILYTTKDYKYIGTVIEINGYIRIKWGRDYEDYFGRTENNYTLDGSFRAMKILTQPADTKDRVTEKMKYLWNTSNWVKKNPTYAY